MRRYPCLSLDDSLEIENDGVVVSVTVITLEPADAVSIVDIDLNIDIEVNHVMCKQGTLYTREVDNCTYGTIAFTCKRDP